MLTEQGIFMGEVFFGKRPSNYTGISAELTKKEGGFFLSSHNDEGEILPTPEILCYSGKYLWDQGIRECPVIVKDEKSQEEHLLLPSTCEDTVTAVTAGVGKADFMSKNIPLRFEKSIINDKITLPDCRPFRLTALRFRSPYAVVFVETVGDCLVLEKGREISSMSIFPQGAEVVFVYSRGEKELYLRTLHRDGSIQVQGADACAAVAAAVAAGRCLPDTAITIPAAKGDFRLVCTKDWELFLTMPVSA